LRIDAFHANGYECGSECYAERDIEIEDINE